MINNNYEDVFCSLEENQITNDNDGNDDDFIYQMSKKYPICALYQGKLVPTDKLGKKIGRKYEYEKSNRRR